MASAILEVTMTRNLNGNRQRIVAVRPRAPGLAKFTGIVSCEEFGRLKQGDRLRLALERVRDGGGGVESHFMEHFPHIDQVDEDTFWCRKCEEEMEAER